MTKLFVSKLCVSKLCVSKLGVCELYVRKLCGQVVCEQVVGEHVGRQVGRRGGSTQPKTRTPHKDVGNNAASFALFVWF